jgi:hypothetical protein
MFKNIVIAILSIFILFQIYLIKDYGRIVDQQDQSIDQCYGIKTVTVQVK